MKRNIYDFDKTIYGGDATLDFFFFCLWRKPILICLLPYYLYAVVQYKLNKISKKCFKEKFYKFLTFIPQVETYVILFWDRRHHKIQNWYIERKRDTDIIISASPEFLLAPICKELNVCLIASKVDKATGRYRGENCYGEEKISRLMDIYPEIVVGEFFSDSISDLPLARIAEKSYLVQKKQIKEWT